MAGVTIVKTAQKAQGRCEKCGKEIAVGDSYKWCAAKVPRAAPGRKRKRCLACPSWHSSETTSSTALSCVSGAHEAAQNSISDWDRKTLDDLRKVAADSAEGTREGAKVCRKSASDIQDGFGHAISTSGELNEKAQTLEFHADEVENCLDSFDG